MAYHKMLGSSVNPNNLSLTLKAFVPLILFAVAYFKIDISETQIDTIITSIGTIVASGTVIYGIVRKVITSLKKEKNEDTK